LGPIKKCKFIKKRTTVPHKEKKYRTLSNEEKGIWSKVTRTIAPKKTKRGQGSSRPLYKKAEFENMMRLPIYIEKPIYNSKAQIELNFDKKTRRGKVRIEMQIDLHDLNQSQAKKKLFKTIISASNKNQTCILVITGKGLRGEGVLRKSLIDWVNAPEIKDIIATYAPAHKKHGGDGAWYIFLKKDKGYKMNLDKS